MAKQVIIEKKDNGYLLRYDGKEEIYDSVVVALVDAAAILERG